MSTDPVCTRECCQPKQFPTFTTKRSRAAQVVSLRRWHPDAPETIAAERNLAACIIGEVIDDVVGRFPRLDDDQFADLVSRLRPPVES